MHLYTDVCNFFRRRQWHPTPVLLPGKSHGQRSLVGCSPWGRYSRTWLSVFTFTFHFHALEKEMATHPSVLARRIPGTGKPGGLPSMGSHRVGHNWSDLAAAAAAAISFDMHQKLIWIDRWIERNYISDKASIVKHWWQNLGGMCFPQKFFRFAIRLKMFKTVLILPAHIQMENTFGENICSLMVDITNIFSKLSGVFTCS